MTILGESNVFDYLTVGVPATIGAAGAVLAAYWARSARGEARHGKEAAQEAADEVRSPNGHTTGEAVEQLRREVLDMRVTQAEFKESVRASRILTADVHQEIKEAREDLSLQMQDLRDAQLAHEEKDDRRFRELEG